MKEIKIKLKHIPLLLLIIIGTPFLFLFDLIDKIGEITIIKLKKHTREK